MTPFIRKIPRNAALLVFLLVLIIVSPAVSTQGYAVVVELVFDLILLSGVYSVGFDRHRWPFLALTAVTLAIRWGQLLRGTASLDMGASFLTALWIAYAVSIIVGHLFRRREVSVDTILGAIVAYLLVAIAFVMVFEIIELRHPGSFAGIPEGASSHRSELASSMIYFSLVSITTMGYGDIVPVSALARPLAVIEGVFGQLYLAVMIARLVGLHISGARDD